MKFLVIGSDGSMGTRRINCLRKLGYEWEGWDIKHGTEMPKDDYSGVFVSTPPAEHEKYMCDHEHALPTFVEASVVKYKPCKTVYPSCTMLFHPIVNQIKDDVRNTRPLHFIYFVGNYLKHWHPKEDYKTKYFAQKLTGGAKEIVAFENIWLNWVFGACEVINGFHGKLSQLEMDADDYYSYTLAFQGGVKGTIVIDTLAHPTYRDFKLIYEGHSQNYDLQLSTEGWNDVYMRETDAFVKAVQGQMRWPHSVEADLQNLNLLEWIEGYNPKSTVWDDRKESA